MIAALKIILPIICIYIALGLLCALWIARRRRTGEDQVAGDPYFLPFGDMPIVPRERLMIAHGFTAWGIPDRKHLSPGALRRNENGGRSPVSKSLSSGPAVVLTFRKVKP